MAGTDFTTHSNQKTKTVSKETRRRMSITYRSSAIDLSKSSSWDDFGVRQRIIYLNGNKECRTVWFYCRDRAKKAFEMIKARYGRAIIYVD